MSGAPATLDGMADLPPQLSAAQERIHVRQETLLERPEHRDNVNEAKRLVRASGEAAGPHVAADRAEALHRSIVPTLPSGFDFLAGRISLTVEEAAPALGIGVRTLRGAVSRGEIPSVKIAGRRLIPLRALERHLEALAYAESGALDMWETMLAKAASTRLQRSRRQAFEARRELRRRMKELRRRANELRSTPGAARAEAEKIVAELAAARTQLSTEELLATRAGEALLQDIEAVSREFGLNDVE